MCTTVCSGGALPRPAQRGCSLVQLSSHYSLPSRKGICLQVIIHDNVFNDNVFERQEKGSESTLANRASSVVRVGGVRGD